MAVQVGRRGRECVRTSAAVASREDKHEPGAPSCAAYDCRPGGGNCALRYSSRKLPHSANQADCPMAPGSIVDVQARRIGEELGHALRQPVVIDNRPGASGTIGLALAAKAPADGYTITMGSTSNLAASPAMGAPLEYDPLKSFEPITLFARTPLVLVANPSLGVRDVKQLVALARAKPGTACDPISRKRDGKWSRDPRRSSPISSKPRGSSGRES